MEKRLSGEKVSVRPKRALLIGSILLLFLSAATRDFGVTPLVARSLGPLAAALVEPIWKGIFWLVPMYLFITRIEQQNPFVYLQLSTNVRRGVIWGLIGSLYFLLQAGAYIFQGYSITLTHSPDQWLNSVLLVGIIEESVFRGFLFQQFQHWFAPLTDKITDEDEEPLAAWVPRWSEVWACLLMAGLFAAIHFPLWLLYVHPSLLLMGTSTIFNIFLGITLCALFRYSRSLWPCIIIHMMNNLITLLFFGM
jgi:uncharacterized protein